MGINGREIGRSENRDDVTRRNDWPDRNQFRDVGQIEVLIVEVQRCRVCIEEGTRCRTDDGFRRRRAAAAYGPATATIRDLIATADCCGTPLTEPVGIPGKSDCRTK